MTTASATSVVSYAPSSSGGRVGLPASFECSPNVVPNEVRPLNRRLRLLPSRRQSSRLHPPFLQWRIMASLFERRFAPPHLAFGGVAYFVTLPPMRL